MTPNDFLKESKLNEFPTLAKILPISENQAKNCMPWMPLGLSGIISLE